MCVWPNSWAVFSSGVWQMCMFSPPLIEKRLMKCHHRLFSKCEICLSNRRLHFIHTQWMSSRSRIHLSAAMHNFDTAPHSEFYLRLILALGVVCYSLNVWLLVITVNVSQAKQNNTSSRSRYLTRFTHLKVWQAFKCLLDLEILSWNIDVSRNIRNLINSNFI